MSKKSSITTTNSALYINNWSNKLLKLRKSDHPSEFYSVSFKLPDSNRFGSFCIPTSCVHDAMHKDKTPVTGFSSIYLGSNPERKRAVSIRSSEDPSSFDVIEMTTAEILDCIEQNRQSYAAQLKSEAVA